MGGRINCKFPDRILCRILSQNLLTTCKFWSRIFCKLLGRFPFKFLGRIICKFSDRILCRILSQNLLTTFGTLVREPLLGVGGCITFDYLHPQRRRREDFSYQAWSRQYSVATLTLAPHVLGVPPPWWCPFA